MSDRDALAGQVNLLGDIIGGYLARIRDHANQPEVVEEWAEKAEEALKMLIAAANGYVADGGTPDPNERTESSR